MASQSKYAVNYDGYKGVVDFNPAEVEAIKAALSTGQISMDDAMNGLKAAATNQNKNEVSEAFGTAANKIKSTVFSGLQGTVNGRTGTYDQSGNFIPGATTTYTSKTGAGGTTTTTSNGNAGGAPQGLSGVPQNISTGDPNLDSLYKALYGMVQNNLSIGNYVNPALNITPDLVSNFLAEAHTQVDPYYQGIMGQAIDGINASLQNMKTQYQNSQGQTLQDFQANLNKERNDAGGAGVAFSGGRGLAESNLQNSANRTLANLDSTYALNTGNAVRTAATALGANPSSLGPGMTGVAIPSFYSLSADLGGAYGGSTPGSALDIGYNPANYNFGSILADPNSGYNAALLKSSNQFQTSYLNSAANNSAVSPSNMTSLGNYNPSPNVTTGISQGLPSFRSLLS